MDKIIAVLAGLILGTLGCLPQLFTIRSSRHGHISVAWGIAATAISFAIMSFALAVMYADNLDLKLIFGVSTVTAFLGLWAAGAYMHRRSISQGK